MSLVCSSCSGRRKEKNTRTESYPDQSHLMESIPSQEPQEGSTSNQVPPARSNNDRRISIESTNQDPPASKNPKQGPSNTAGPSNTQSTRPPRKKSGNENFGKEHSNPEPDPNEGPTRVKTVEEARRFEERMTVPARYSKNVLGNPDAYGPIAGTNVTRLRDGESEASGTQQSGDVPGAQQSRGRVSEASGTQRS